MNMARRRISRPKRKAVTVSAATIMRDRADLRGGAASARHGHGCLGGILGGEVGTASRVDIARASSLGNLATRDDLTAISLRNFDASTFNAWFIAFTLNSPQKEAIAVRRFRPVFLVAFDAWMATDPLHNPHAPPGPT